MESQRGNIACVSLITHKRNTACRIPKDDAGHANRSFARKQTPSARKELSSVGAKRDCQNRTAVFAQTADAIAGNHTIPEQNLAKNTSTLPPFAATRSINQLAVWRYRDHIHRV